MRRLKSRRIRRRKMPLLQKTIRQLPKRQQLKTIKKLRLLLKKLKFLLLKIKRLRRKNQMMTNSKMRRNLCLQMMSKTKRMVNSQRKKLVLKT
jgi:hypothetical protein